MFSSASANRVREVFRSQLRTLHSFAKDSVPWPPARNMGCLVLDGTTASMLADHKFMESPDDGDYLDEYREFEGKNIKVVDSSWSRQPTEWWPDDSLQERPYRGVDLYPIVFLRDLYFDITLAACRDSMRVLNEKCRASFVNIRQYIGSLIDR